MRCAICEGYSIHAANFLFLDSRSWSMDVRSLESKFQYGVYICERHREFDESLDYSFYSYSVVEVERGLWMMYSIQTFDEIMDDDRGYEYDFGRTALC